MLGIIPYTVYICVLDCSYIPEGDKYKVAKRWGHIHIVTMKWFDQSVARRACLNEESYPVQSGSLSSRKVTRDLTAQHSQEKDIGKMQSGSSSRAADSNMLVSDCTESMDIDPEATQSEHMSSVSNVPLFVKEADAEACPLQTSNQLNLDGAVANDSESDDNDLYLAECRISLVGFEASEMRKLVNMVRKGGGSRYMSLNDKLTHIVIGNPTEMEKKDVRSIAAQSVIFVVKTSWLEDCDRQKRQVPVLGRHTANDLVLPKVKGAVTGIVPMDQSKSSSFRQSFQTDKVVGIKEFGVIMAESLEKNKQEKHDMGMNVVTFDKASGRTTPQTQLPDKKLRGQKMTQRDSNVHVKSTNVFKGKTFCFSNLFPEERRAEIVQWISQGGGEIISGQTKQSIHYTIECHGKPKSTGDYGSTYISSHWIRSCLEDGSLLDVDSHILYSPLPCRVPLPGFENLRFCVSQYEEKDRILLWNLCKVLGAKFADKLTKKVTHLLCKFTNGPKYEASCKWGIRSVTSEWIFECVKQNGVIAMDQFLPKEVTTQDREAGACTVSQFPTQAVQMINDMPSQFPSQSQSSRHTANKNVDNHRTHSKISSINSKKARLMEEPSLYNKAPSTVNSGIHVSDMNFSKANMLKDAPEAVEMINDTPPQFPSQLQSMRNMADKNVDSGDANHGTHSKISSINSIKSRLVEEPGMYNKAPSTVNLGIHVSDLNISEDNMLKDDREATHAVPDVAAAIEDLLEQTSKMHDQRSPGHTGCERSIYTSDCPVIGEDNPNPRTVFGLSKHWLNRIGSNDDNGETSKERKVGMYDAFSESQTESQIVGYEEDLSGRQMLIDRVLTRSSMQ
ncbi:putative BRCT domain-containing protein [Medicago truncatula]|uniref:Putative BRCT domain-containing protein n=1 Tax=Medicago truncatula TaxID=3880 RepID=A0A396JNQ1_MEDTR|nr:putative BRCT domain-containing protein [Medicago truncatula]